MASEVHFRSSVVARRIEAHRINKYIETTWEVRYAQDAIRNLSWRYGGIRRRRRQCKRGTDQDVAEPEGLGDADRKLCQPSLLAAQADHRRQCWQAAGCVDVLDRRAARPRGWTAGDRRFDVCPRAVPEYRLRAQSQGREQDRLEV